MKKLFLALAFVAGISSLASAQVTTTSKMKTTTPVTKQVTTPPTTTPTMVKKDGTADMRFKANKKKHVGPLKKDGTADMRYNTNKAAASAAKPATTTSTTAKPAGATSPGRMQ